MYRYIKCACQPVSRLKIQSSTHKQRGCGFSKVPSGGSMWLALFVLQATAVAALPVQMRSIGILERERGSGGALARGEQPLPPPSDPLVLLERRTWPCAWAAQQLALGAAESSVWPRVEHSLRELSVRPSAGRRTVVGRSSDDCPMAVGWATDGRPTVVQQLSDHCAKSLLSHLFW